MAFRTDEKITILLSTGEVSGDRIGANLVEALRSAHSNLFLWGIGGGRMEKAGVKILYSTNQLGSVGISEPFATFPAVLKSFNRIRFQVRKSKPDLAILIGYDIFNLALSRWLRKRKVLTISYFPPQVWLWRGIAGVFARNYDWILTSFLVEDQVYRQAGGQTVFVGHYLMDQIETRTPKHTEEARKALSLGKNGAVVGLFPGSRTHELDRMVPVMLEIAGRIAAGDPRVEFVLPVADSCFDANIRSHIERAGMKQRIHLCYDSRTAMAACDLVILCSGTVTLEAALMGVPMIILYQVSLSSWVTVNLLESTGLIASKTLGLPNLLAGKRIVPEFIQSRVLPTLIAKEAWDILRNPNRQKRMKQDLASVRAQLGEKGSAARAAATVLKIACQRRRDRLP